MRLIKDMSATSTRHAARLATCGLELLALLLAAPCIAASIRTPDEATIVNLRLLASVPYMGFTCTQSCHVPPSESWTFRLALGPLHGVNTAVQQEIVDAVRLVALPAAEGRDVPPPQALRALTNWDYRVGDDLGVTLWLTIPIENLPEWDEFLVRAELGEHPAFRHANTPQIRITRTDRAVPDARGRAARVMRHLEGGCPHDALAPAREFASDVESDEAATRSDRVIAQQVLHFVLRVLGQDAEADEVVSRIQALGGEVKGPLGHSSGPLPIPEGCPTP